jgi:hypothetical protein
MDSDKLLVMEGSNATLSANIETNRKGENMTT